MPVIDVPMGSYSFAAAPAVLRSLGIGSCVAVTLYDARRKLGALAHIMLPVMPQGARDDGGNSLKFADHAIARMVAEFTERGSEPSALEAKIIGGAQMFPGLEPYAGTVGEENVSAVEKELKKHGITVIDQDVGGHFGKSVSLDLTTGVIDVKFKM